MKSSNPEARPVLDAITSLLHDPSPVAVSGLMGLMLVTLYIGIMHATDVDEDTSIRLTGVLLAAISIGTLGTSGYALLQK